MLPDVFTAAGLLDAGKRSLKTFALHLAGSLAVFTGLLDVDWRASLSAAGLIALVELLSTVGGTAKATKE
ncbi:holin [Nocardia fluminea]|uniref:holin n=1 Tax=Nocardia fluminea TaxID=134984 RepID=UPI003658B1D0